MIRNFNTLWLSLVAILAFGAVVTSAASAQKLTSDGPVTLTVTETVGAPEAANALTAFGSSMRCPGSTYAGHKYNVTPHTMIPSGETTITFTPKYTNCTLTALNFPTTIEMNGCDYVYHLQSPPPSAIILTTIECPVGFHIVLTAKSGGSTICTITITENKAGYEGLAVSAGAIRGTIKGIEAHRSGSFCATETTQTAELHQDVSVKGHNSEGGATSISVS